jgi:broad specificity phosphatase PhoE
MSSPIYITRHGQTDWNAAARVQGQAEADLNALGRGQAASNGEKLARLIPDPSGFRFVASPMRRTRETMEIIRETMGLPRQGYDLEPRIVEVHFGDWQGSTFAELEVRAPGTTAAREADKWNFVPPGAAAESYAMLEDRIRPWLLELEGPVLVVTHGGVIRTLFHMLNGLSDREAAAMDIHQDRVLTLEDGRIAWV